MTGPRIPFPFPDPGQSGLPAELSPHPTNSSVSVSLPSGTPAELICGYDELRQLLTDARFSRAAAATHGMTARSAQSLALNSADPPDHTRRRRAVAGGFTSRRAEAERPWIRATARDLVATMTARGRQGDLIAEFSLPLSVAVICRTLGVPSADLPQFRPAAEVMMSTHGHSAHAIRSAHAQVFDYFSRRYDAELSRASEAPTVLRDLVQAVELDGTLSREEAVHVAYGILIAGYETSSNMIAICVSVLLADRSRWEHLHDNPDILRPAVEEMMRWTSLISTGGVPHVAAEDVMLGSYQAGAGQVLVPFFAAANRDPRVFHDPNRLLLDRDGPPHLAFGHGRHSCLGASLARVELQEAIGELGRAVPALDLAVPKSELRWRLGTFIRGLVKLPVRW